MREIANENLRGFLKEVINLEYTDRSNFDRLKKVANEIANFSKEYFPYGMPEKDCRLNLDLIEKLSSNASNDTRADRFREAKTQIKRDLIAAISDFRVNEGVDY